MSSEEKMSLGLAEENESLVCGICGLRFMPSEPNQIICDNCEPKTRNLDRKIEPITKQQRNIEWSCVKGLAILLVFLGITYAMNYIINEVAKIGVA